MFLIISDKNMYHKKIDTRAAAWITIVSDLILVEYIFSDKTGTSAQNVMQFKRFLVDRIMFGTPVVKSIPSDIGNRSEVEALADQEFHLLDKLLVGKIPMVLPLELGLSQSKIKNTVGPRSLFFKE